MQLHASCVARDGRAVLLVGAPGSGKSDLVLRLLDHGFALVADDRVDVADGLASPPPSLAGLLEIRGLGIVRMPYAAPARLALVVQMGRDDRLPQPSLDARLGLPVVSVDPAQPSAPARIAVALACATGRLQQVAGAFA